MFQEMIDHLKEVGGRAALQGADRRARSGAAGPRRVAPGAPVRLAGAAGRRRDVAPATPADRVAPRAEPRTADGQKVGRNDPCPCGSGKKYKKCCLLKGA